METLGGDAAANGDGLERLFVANCAQRRRAGRGGACGRRWASWRRVGLAVRPPTIGAVRTESPADYGTEFGMTKWTATSVRSRPRRSSRGANAERQQYGADRPPTEQPRLAGLDPNPPVAFLQSCPMLSAGVSSFASTKQPFVTSGSRRLWRALHKGRYAQVPVMNSLGWCTAESPL